MRLIIVALLSGLIVSQAATGGEPAAPQFVGRAVCASCHSAQDASWSNSHHDLAMQLVDSKTVLGDFEDARLSHFGVSSSFFKKDGKFMVRTESGDGALQDYEIKYTFGVEPLQQYLVEFPGGRLQALSVAWDARPKAQGGQRWFHLYPDEKIAHDDELHWTGPAYNWNSMCAECHSTRLEKNYDPASKTFSTTWSEIDVSCEACHGPGSGHVGWAERKPGWEQQGDRKGLALLLDERKGVDWKINPATGTATRSKVRDSEREIGMCARCHSRRGNLSGQYVHGEPFLDHYRPRLLDAGMYHADGQIQDEVYVYGSFVQSRMYHAGVTCSDCHDPHSTQLQKPGNGVCLQCHQAQKYDSASHHFHKLDSTGASCAECHMPPTRYMVIDPRHDHSIRIPRPDLSVTLGTPNACNNCHADKEPVWAASQLKTWYGHTPAGFQQYAGALTAARNGEPAAGATLAALIRDTDAPDIARATAVAGFGPWLTPQTLDVLTLALGDENPQVRAAAIDMLEQTPAALRVKLAFPMLEDPLRLVRIEAARLLASIPPGDLNKVQREQLERGVQEYVEAQHASAERPEAQSNLGNLYAAQGEAGKAESAYQAAMELNPAYVPAYVNLADFYRSQNNEAAAEKVLRQAVDVAPGNAAVHYALGLSLVRQKRTDEAVTELRLAATLNPDDAHTIYVYAVSLHSTGEPEKALMVLRGAQNRFPNNIEILQALVAFSRDAGNEAAAREFAGKLRAISP